jgi:hypothetical protein
MSEQVSKIGFGYVDDTDEKLKSRSGGSFGLNQALLTKFEYNPNAGKDGTAANAIDIVFQVGDREFNSRIYETTKVYDKNSNEITDVNSKEYIDAYNADWTQKNAVIVHILKAFRTDAEVKQAFSAPIADFASFANIAQSLLPDGFNTKPLDVFLEYQWSISDGQDRTYLQLPRNMKGGYFVVPAQPGTWKEEIAEDGSLSYKNESGAEHPFKRDKNFMEGPKANQQKEGEELPAPGSASGGAGSATASTW